MNLEILESRASKLKLEMNFKDLFWGAFLWVNLNRDTYGYSDYNRLAGDKKFLERLQLKPSLDDFHELRGFLVHFGVHQAPKKLAEQYAKIWPLLESHIDLLRKETIENIDLTEDRKREAISTAFSYLQWPYSWGGDTVASKVLHFLNLDLFIMWDSNIQSHYGKYGAEGYIEFLEIMQGYAKSVIDDYQNLSPSKSLTEYLSDQLGYTSVKTLAKFLDDYNWVTITKKWPNTIPSWLLV